MSGSGQKRKQTGVAQYMWGRSTVLPNRSHNQAQQPVFVLIHLLLGPGLPAVPSTVTLLLMDNTGGLQHFPQPW